MNTSSSRSGVTIVEVLVTMGILGILAAILVPAVQQSRGTARKLQCANHLHQIGLGMAQFSEAHGTFPTKEQYFVELMPYLDMANLKKQIEEGKIQEPIIIPWIDCPEDGQVQRNYGAANYLLNDGTRFHYPSPVKGIRRNGFSSGSDRNTRPDEITDGLSQTAAMSERLVVPVDQSAGSLSAADPLRSLWYTTARFGRNATIDQMAETCRSTRSTPYPQFLRVPGQFNTTWIGYDHILPPNEVGCYNGPEDFDLESDMSVITATSLHKGGVNVLFADGSVHFVASGISKNVWHALGTRAGAESAPFQE